MAGLNDININQPTGLDDPRQGDNEIRLTKAKTIEFAGVEHSLDGKHKFQKVSVLPSNDVNSKRIVIYERIVDGDVVDELWYDNGVEWKALTDAGAILEINNELVSHKALSPIDHPDASVTTAKLANGCVVESKIGNGAVLGRHLNAAEAVNEDYSVAPLIDGSILDGTWHKHSASAITDSTSGLFFLNGQVLVTETQGLLDWTQYNANTGAGVPLNAKGVILLVYVYRWRADEYEETFYLDGRKESGYAPVTLCWERYRVPGLVYHQAQVICPLKDGNGTFEYKMDFLNKTPMQEFAYYWGIWVVGYFA